MAHQKQYQKKRTHGGTENQRLTVRLVNKEETQRHKLEGNKEDTYFGKREENPLWQWDQKHLNNWDNPHEKVLSTMIDTKHSINVSFLSLFLSQISALKSFYVTGLFPDNVYHNSCIWSREKITKDSLLQVVSNFWWNVQLYHLCLYLCLTEHIKRHNWFDHILASRKCHFRTIYPKDRSAIVVEWILRKQILVSGNQSGSLQCPQMIHHWRNL